MDIRRIHAFPAFLLLCLTLPSGGCDMIEYHPYDLDIDGETGINAKNISLIESGLEGRTEIAFAVISDTQRWYDETEDAVAAINARDDIDFVIHTGDISDFGLKMEMEKQRDILNELDVPYVCVLGNHDCLATGLEAFNTIFGENNFAFTAGNVHVVGLNTNALEFDDDTSVPDFDFLAEDLANLPSQVEKTVVAMHAAPYSEQFNNDAAESFEEAITRYPDLCFCLYGHQHSVTVSEFFNDGIIYYECACAKDRTYLYFTLDENGYTYEVVSY